jgi:4-hydroxy-tetrahydrodipicolinate reductase
MSTGHGQQTRIIVVGAGGRMGSRVCAIAHADRAFALIGALEHAGSTFVGRSASPESGGEPAPKIVDSARVFTRSCADVVIDFSSDQGAHASMALARSVDCALLMGTTALSEATREALREESRGRAILLAPNTSLGVAALADLVRRAASMLPGYDCSIVESHHNQKKDAPSGTAIRLAESAKAGGADRIETLSVRGGDVVGEHTVRFAGPGEYIELTHRATSRDLFARGALAASAWLRGRGPGWWTMEDVLGLSTR